MSKKLMLLALAAVSAVMFALPAVASAEWKITPVSQNFTGSSVGTTTLTTNQNETVTCTSSTGSGTVDETGTKGTITLTFHGCKEDSAGTTCTTPGQPSGTITSTTLDWTTVFLTHDKTKPGVKIEGTTNGEKHGHISTFKCGFGLVTIEVFGSVVGEVEGGCQKNFTELPILFESTSHGVQKWMQNTETGEKTDLTAFRNGSPRTASEDATGILKTSVSSSMDCE